MIALAWVLLALSVAGFGVTFPLWILGSISDSAMIGLTLALSWMALIYSAALFIFEAKRAKREAEDA